MLEGEDNPPPPDENAAAIMQFMDSLSPKVRALIHEYGFKIVTESLDGSVSALEDELEFWRYRRQEEWLNTDYFPTRAVSKRSVMT